MFPARGNDEATFSGFSKLKRKLDQLSEVSAWTLHDLRRSAATHMGRLGVAPHVVERILNHESGVFAVWPACTIAFSICRKCATDLSAGQCSSESFSNKAHNFFGVSRMSAELW